MAVTSDSESESLDVIFEIEPKAFCVLRRCFVSQIRTSFKFFSRIRRICVPLDMYNQMIFPFYTLYAINSLAIVYTIIHKSKAICSVCISVLLGRFMCHSILCIRAIQCQRQINFSYFHTENLSVYIIYLIGCCRQRRRRRWCMRWETTE